MKRVFLAAFAAFFLLPTQVAWAVCEFNGEDVVHTGMYSPQWNSTADLDAFEAAGGGPLTFAGTFHHLYEGAENTNWILDRVWDAEATPVVNLEVPVTAAEMASGEYDDDVAVWAAGVQRWLDADPRHALIIAPLQEMNGDWVPWGMDPPNFIIAYRRIVEIFRDMGMDETQIRWMFAPNGVSTFPYSATNYWPGDDVVDVVGLSAYNFGHEFGLWSSVKDTLFDVTEQLRAFARNKPFLIAQIATSQVGGDREGWLTDMFDFVANHPNHLGFIYFNFDKETNWRVWDGETVAQGWLDAMEDPRVRYEFPLDPWFRPGAIPFEWDPRTAYPRPETFCTTATISDPPEFSDVSDGLFYSLPIRWLARAGLASGYDDGTFRPEQPVTRAEAITLMWRVACGPTDVPPADFSDLAAEWYQDAVGWASATETAKGYPDGTFRPDAEVTRAETAQFLWRMNTCPGGEPTGFDDVPVRSWYADAVEWMVEQGMASGTSVTTFSPDDPVTRGELVTLLFRMPSG